MLACIAILDLDFVFFFYCVSNFVTISLAFYFRFAVAALLVWKQRVAFSAYLYKNRVHIENRMGHCLLSCIPCQNTWKISEYYLIKRYGATLPKLFSVCLLDMLPIPYVLLCLDIFIHIESHASNDKIFPWNFELNEVNKANSLICKNSTSTRQQIHVVRLPVCRLYGSFTLHYDTCCIHAKLIFPCDIW